MSIISLKTSTFSHKLSNKLKSLLLLAVFTASSFNVFTQTTSLISTCSDFVAGPTSWPYVLVATTLADGSISQGAQTFTMNVTDTASGASFRVAKTTANGNWFFGPAIAMTLGTNTITVPAVTFDRSVKFQFSNGAVEFDALSLNGVATSCICISSYYTDVVQACDSYSWIDGNTYTSSNNTATDTLISANGCDSVITLDLTITSSFTVTDSVIACDSYTWIDGITYTSSNNTATDTLINFFGCDSIVTLYLTITTVDSTVFVLNDSTLQAQSVDTGTIYQWLDCNNNFSPIFGEINSTFTTQNPGNYAVEISLNGCSAISECFTITPVVGIDVFDTEYEIQLFPNPTTNDLTISLNGINVVDIEIMDIQGKILLQQSGLFDQNRIDLSAYVVGTYFIKIITPEGYIDRRVTKY